MPQPSHIVKQDYRIRRRDREKLLGQRPLVIWLTGLSGSGKSTLAGLLEQALYAEGIHTYLLDGDNLRYGLNNNLGFSDEDRAENIRRTGEVAKLFYDAATVVITAFISPFRADRDRVRQLFPEDAFAEIFIDCPLEVCEQRDIKGLYAKARKGEIPAFTGISSPFEEPLHPELVIHTDENTVTDCVNMLLNYSLKRIKADQE